jgi:c-di-GMP-binding flagellar brake protein YcgR
MNITELQIGTKLELEPFNEDGIKLDYTLVSEFEQAYSENIAIIAAPIHEGYIYPVRIGTVMNIHYSQKYENDYNLFMFKAKVIGRETSENLALLKVEIIGEIKKIQRRNYYRLECSIPVQFRIVNSYNSEYNKGIPFQKTIATDLSGGGIGLRLEERIEIGKLLECEILTEESKTIKFCGKLVRYYKNDVEGKFKFHAGVSYIKISNNDREAVVKYIFTEQRKMRKKGLI